MRGTGSKDVRLQNCIIPAYRTISWSDAQAGIYPGSTRNTGAMYRLPLNAVFALSTAMGVVGGAYGLLDSVVELGRKRIANANQAAQGNDTFNQAELGQCASMVHMAYQLLIADVDEMFAQAEQNTAFTQEQRARYRADAATAARTAVGASERIVVTCGGALLPEGPLERAFRDVHGMASHFLLQPHVGGELYGKALYGVAIPASIRL
ncbi:Flavin-dependent monooxygenase, oxygenase subunit HsaA [compost metagenome]